MTNRRMGEIIWDQKPVTLSPEASVREACKCMLDRRVGAVLVVDRAGRLQGIFTDRDAVRCLTEPCDPANTPLQKVMTGDPETMSARATAIEALRLMRDCGFRHIPVVENGVLIGVVSRSDFHGLEHGRLEEETRVWERI